MQIGRVHAYELGMGDLALIIGRKRKKQRLIWSESVRGQNAMVICHSAGCWCFSSSAKYLLLQNFHGRRAQSVIRPDQQCPGRWVEYFYSDGLRNI